MSKLTKYESIEEMKATSKPMDTASSLSEERHHMFENFINFLKDNNSSETSSSNDNKLSSRKTDYGLQ